MRERFLNFGLYGEADYYGGSAIVKQKKGARPQPKSVRNIGRLLVREVEKQLREERLKR